MQINQKKTVPLVATLTLLTAVPGSIALSTASVSNLGWQLGNGSSQRLYEARFDNAFPLRDLSRTTWAAFKIAAFGEVADGAILGVDGWLYSAEEFEEPSAAPDFEEELRDIAGTIGSFGADFLVVLVPDKARVMSAKLPTGRSAAFENRYEAHKATLVEMGITVVDAGQVLQTMDPSTTPYLRTDTHWSPEGAEAVANAVAGTVDAANFSQTGFRTQQTGTAPFVGDLLAFADTGVWSNVGPKAETISTYSTVSTPDADGGNMGLFGDAEVPIALVGTSYSTLEDFHFEGFLKSALQADVVNYSQVGRGPFHPMHRFLDQMADTHTLPDLVIWEIPERYLSTRSAEK